jgi:hypothetical protein
VTPLIPFTTARRLAFALATFGSAVMLATASSALAGRSSIGGANFVATGHDMDFHCAVAGPEEVEQECKYLKIVVDKVRNGSSLPILALDQGNHNFFSGVQELTEALKNAGYTGAGEVVTVDPADTTAFDETAFVNGKGEPLYSAIITASDETCEGCDNNEEGENNINARAADFKAYFNAGGGILALAGAHRFETYYNFVPLKVGATAVEPPFTVTSEGEALGITNEEANCCVTHNSFTYPPPEPFVTLERDNAEKAETIAAFNVKITEQGFSTITTTLSGEGKSGEKITVEGGTAVTDSATLSGANAEQATGTVEYNVYSDPECKTLVAEAGSVSVSGGVVPSSNPETLAPGTYYWQASYSGDELNKPATSGCGEEVETVEAPKCSQIHGNGHWGPRGGPEGGNLGDKLSTNLGEKQELQTKEPAAGFHIHLTHLQSASCVAIAGGFEFSGTGSVEYNHEKHGYSASFAFAITGGHTYYTLVIEHEGSVIYALLDQQLRRGGTEHIS